MDEPRGHSEQKIKPGHVADLKKQVANILMSVYQENEAETLARIFISDVLEQSYIEAFTEKIWIEGELFDQLENSLQGALKGVPWQYIIGEVEFCGLKISVGPSVLIPRPETEELAMMVMDEIKNNFEEEEAIKILDAGTGSGCIGLSIAAGIPKAEVWGIDNSREALATAEANARWNNIRFRTRQANLLDLPPNDLPVFDVLVSNPPYIPPEGARFMKSNVLDHEPASALFTPEHDPLIFYHALAVWAETRLRQGGHIYFEIFEEKARDCIEIFRAKGYQHLRVLQDFRGKDRFLFGRKQEYFYGCDQNMMMNPIQ